MSNPVKPIPDGYHSVTPYLYLRDASSLIEFYKRAFGATELFRMNGPGGLIGHAELQIGSSRIMLCTLVAITTDSRRALALRNRPTTASLSPPEYTLAVSKKLMPKSRA